MRTVVLGDRPAQLEALIARRRALGQGVDEVLIADPVTRGLWLFVLQDGSYHQTERSELLGITVAELHAAVDWPGAS